MRTVIDVPDGEIGSLLIKGDAVCSCYWNQHEKTKETIQGHWVRTGDKYYRDPDGYYWYVGRYGRHDEGQRACG